MASVLHGYDPHFKRDVAVKILPQQFLHDSSFRVRFEREAQTIAALEHPAIVPVYDYGDEEGQPYLVMRFMAGGSLSDRLAQGPLPLAEAATILQRVGSALDETHAQDIIHRDLKPANILFDGRGDAFLSDFGIAKIAEPATALTVEGTAMGTVQYMSPEQAEGRSTLDGRSDIYALGAVLFHLLTGQLPYQATTVTGMILAHINRPVPRILPIRPDLPPACEEIITWAMAKDPDDRCASAGELAKTLAAVAGGQSISARPDAPESAAQLTTVGPTPTSQSSEQAEGAPTVMSSDTAAQKRGGLFGRFKAGLGQGFDKLKETTSVTLSQTPPPFTQDDGPPAPYPLIEGISIETPEDLPTQCELAWEEGFQGFKNGNIQHWLEAWQKFYRTEGETARQDTCRVYIKHNVNLRGQLHFKSTLAQQALFEKFLRFLGGATPKLAVQLEHIDLGEIVGSETGQTEIELRHAGQRGLVSGQVTVDVPWLEVGEQQTSLFTSFLPGSKDYNFYLRPDETTQVTLTVQTETLKGGDYTANLRISPDGSNEQTVTISLKVNVEALLDPIHHQSATASEMVCRKILRVEPDRLRVKFMLAQAIIELGLHLVKHMPTQALTYAQEAQNLLATVDRSEDDLEVTAAEITAAKEGLAKLWVRLGDSS
jgi:serine/threonine protein kinase